MRAEGVPVQLKCERVNGVLPFKVGVLLVL